eukprot:1904533-Amphidinium_carterae.1
MTKTLVKCYTQNRSGPETEALGHGNVSSGALAQLLALARLAAAAGTAGSIRLNESALSSSKEGPCSTAEPKMARLPWHGDL